MKHLLIKFALTALVLFDANFSFGSVWARCQYDRKENNFGLKPEEYLRLQRATLYFVIPEKLMDNQDIWQNCLDSVWDYSEIEVIGMNEMGTHISEKNAAFFSLAYKYEPSYITNIYMQLMIVRDLDKKIDEKNMIDYANFDLDSDCEMMKMRLDNKISKDQFVNYVSNKANISNLTPAIVSSYLRYIEVKLNDRKCKAWGNPEELSNLKTETLYITDNVIRYSHRSKCKDAPINIDKLMSKYPYTYQLISFDDLNQKLLNGEDFIYAICIDLGTWNTISIYNSVNGEEIYDATYNGHEHFFVPKDFKILADKINKGI